jgi:O-antigen/teichoic acid export membrane protein
VSSLRERLWASASDPTARKGLLAVVDQGLVSACGFTTSVIVGRAASQEQLGLYYLAMSLILFARGLQETLTCMPYAVYCHRRRDEALATYTGSCLSHTLVFSGLVVLALLALVATLTAGVGPGALAPTVWVLLAAGPFLLLREFIRQVAFASLRVGVAIAIDGVVAVLQIGALAALVLRGGISAPSAFAAIGGACAVACLGWLFLRVEPLRFARRSLVGDWRHNWTLSKWAVAGQLAGSSAVYVMPWILTRYHGAEETGLLAAGVTLVGAANIFVVGINNFLTPKTARAYVEGGAAGLRRVLWTAALVFGAVLGGFTLLAVMAGGPLVSLVYGESYAGAGPVVATLAACLLATALAMTAGSGMYAVEQTRLNFFCDVLSTVAAIAVALFVVEPLGALGAALSGLVGAVISAVAKFTLLWRVLTPGSAPRAIEPLPPRVTEP